MFDEARKIIEEITEDCPRTGASLSDALAGLEDVSCAGTGTGKEAAFNDAEKAIAQAQEDCPGHKEDLARLFELVEAGRSVKCDGG